MLTTTLSTCVTIKFIPYGSLCPDWSYLQAKHPRNYLLVSTFQGTNTSPLFSYLITVYSCSKAWGPVPSGNQGMAECPAFCMLGQPWTVSMRPTCIITSLCVHSFVSLSALFVCLSLVCLFVCFLTCLSIY